MSYSRPTIRGAFALAMPLSLLALGSASSCGDAAPPAPNFVSTDGRMRDPQGREVLFHGVNARVAGIFDVEFSDGRTALEPLPPFVEEDCRFLGEDLGLNHLRLPVNWSAIEPNEGDFRQDYVDRVLEIAAMCERHGVHTLVDFHQDAFSKEIGEDGAPLWAIHPAPTMLLQGPLTDLDVRRASAQVAAAFDALFNDASGGWDEYATMARWVAQRIDGQPGIVGLELYNEPILILGEDAIQAFQQHVTDQVRRVAPNLTVFFEPNALRNISDMAPVSTPFARPNTVYAPHVYTDVFEGGWDPATDLPKLQQSVAAARGEATAHGAALYVGEFGDDDSARGAQYVTEAMRAFDAQRASWALWVYEEWSQGSWGLYDAVSGPPAGRVGLRAARADLVARAYPTAIAGDIASFVYDETTRTLTVTLANARGDLDHELAAPARTYPNGVAITCDGSPVVATSSAGRARVRCAGTTLVLEPAP